MEYQTRRFAYAFREDKDTSMPELLARDGRTVVVLRQLRAEEADGPEVDPGLERMFKVCDPEDGFSWDAFESELIEQGE